MAFVASDVEMGATVELFNPVEHYLELAMRGEVSDFHAEMGKHPLGITAGRDVYEDRSPLHMAALHGRLEIVKLIMASPAISSHVLNARDRFGYTPLHLAVRSEHVDIVRILTTSPLTRFYAASSEQDEQGHDCDGFTPLHLAAAMGNIAIVKLLLLQEQDQPAVNIHATTWQGTTALDIAKQRSHVKLVEILECWDVNWLQLERQKSANSVNAILVGAALVATVAFGCLLQSPLIVSGDRTTTFDLWVSFMAMSWFVGNIAYSLSFSIVSLVIGTSSSIRSSRCASLKSEVSQLRTSVFRASTCLFVAIFYLILASLQGTELVYLKMLSAGPTRGKLFMITLWLCPIISSGFAYFSDKKLVIVSFLIVVFVCSIAIYCATGFSDVDVY